MQKRRLFVILSAILAISMIGLSATCLAPGEAPKLELEIYDGPDYSKSDDMCYYRVEAIATGMPEPEIVFDNDNNVDSLSSDRVEVGVEASDFYTLTATATNSAGTASVSIVLEGECSEPAPEEVVEEGASDEEEKVVDKEEPEEAADSDGESGEEEPEEETEIVEDVHAYYFPALADSTLSGFITQDTGVTSGGGSVHIGDNIDDMQIKGYISFDISSLFDITADFASVTISNIELIRNPENIGTTLRIKYFEYGELDISDFMPGGITIGDWEILGMDRIRFEDTNTSFLDSLNAAINDPYIDYYQLKLGINGTTNGDGRSDLIAFDLSDVLFEISYYQ